jgi:MFS transporter, MHS family, proline/betaine transporter
MSVKTKALREKLSHVTRTKPVTVPETASVREVLALMREKQAHCVMVCKGPALSGIFTERDYLMKVLGRAKGAEPIRDFMTPKPLIATLDQTLGEAIEAMNAKGLRNLPLVDEQGAPASLLTVNAIIRYLADHFPAQVVNRPPAPMVSNEQDGA